MNVGKYKVMVGSSDGNIIVNCGKRPRGKRVKANTVMCTVYKRWIHKRYSSVRDNLSLVLDGFRCH